MTTTAVSTVKIVNVADIDPVELTVEERGDGQAFLLLHGGAGPRSVAAFAQLLAEKDRNRVLTPTHPGFGGTPRPQGLQGVAGLAVLYTSLLDDLGLEDVTVIGNSVGGWIAAEMALLESPRISGLVLIDAVGIAVEGRPVADVSSLSVPEIQALSFHDPTPFRVDPATIPDAQIVEPAYGQTYAAAIHGARFVELPGTGHMPQMETPDLVLQTIRNSGGSTNGLG
jgi:pimeloyl-ACP methyl ester carboxylesterase